MSLREVRHKWTTKQSRHRSAVALAKVDQPYPSVPQFNTQHSISKFPHLSVHLLFLSLLYSGPAPAGSTFSDQFLNHGFTRMNSDFHQLIRVDLPALLKILSFVEGSLAEGCPSVVPFFVSFPPRRTFGVIFVVLYLFFGCQIQRENGRCFLIFIKTYARFRGFRK